MIWNTLIFSIVPTSFAENSIFFKPPRSKSFPNNTLLLWPLSPYNLIFILELFLFFLVYFDSEFSLLDVSIIAKYLFFCLLFCVVSWQYPQFIPPFIGSNEKVGSFTIDFVQHHFYLIIWIFTLSRDFWLISKSACEEEL